MSDPTSPDYPTGNQAPTPTQVTDVPLSQQPQPPPPDGRLLALEARVEGIVGAVKNVADAVSSLNEKIDKRGQTPWPVIFSALGVMLTFTMAIGGLAYMPINTGIADLKLQMSLSQDRAEKRFEGMAGKLVSRDEHEVHWRAQDRDYDFMRERIGRVENRLNQRVERLEGSHFKASN